jgi:hypothetical protein
MYGGTFIQIISSIPLLVLIYLAHYYKRKRAFIGLVIALIGVNIFFTCMWIASLNSELS